MVKTLAVLAFFTAAAAILTTIQRTSSPEAIQATQGGTAETTTATVASIAPIAPPGGVVAVLVQCDHFPNFVGEGCGLRTDDGKYFAGSSYGWRDYEVELREIRGEFYLNWRVRAYWIGTFHHDGAETSKAPTIPFPWHPADNSGGPAGLTFTETLVIQGQSGVWKWRVQ